MALVEMVMPKMGESVMEGTILKWLKNVGEEIEEEESVLEVATDKVDTEVPAPFAGVLKEILAQEGDVIEVGKPIAIINTNGEADANDVAAQSQPTNEAKQVTEEVTSTVAEVAATASSSTEKSATGRFYSPLVKNIAKRENISMAELDQVAGTGKDGRVTKKDILTHIEQKRSTPVVEKSAPAVAVSSKPAARVETPVKTVPVSIDGGDEIIEMDRMRKMIAQRMVDSKRISPHVTSFVEADLSAVVKWRNAHKNSFKERGYGSLTFTPIFIEAIAKAIRDYPMMNVQVEGDKIIKKRNINIGMAVALPSGNLIVPVIKNADQLNLAGLAIQVNDLAKRARANQLKPDELGGGTYTMSNVGTFGNVMGTPILMQPQVGIMAFGAIRKKPSVIETSEGDLIGIRHKMFLSHSYDHRVVDGSLGGMFVRRVADYLEKFDANQQV